MTLLTTTDLSVTFGGLRAVDGVDGHPLLQPSRRDRMRCVGQASERADDRASREVGDAGDQEQGADQPYE